MMAVQSKLPPRLIPFALGFMNDPLSRLKKLSKQGRLIFKSSPDNASLVFAFGAGYNQIVVSNPDIFYTPQLPVACPDPNVSRLMQGLIFMNGAPHRRNRRLIMPVFHKKYIENYADDMIRLTQQHLDNWTVGTVIDMVAEMHTLTLHIVNKTIFGRETTLEQNVSQMIQDWLDITLNPYNMIVPFNIVGTPTRQMVNASAKVNQLMRELIQEKRDAPDNHYDVLSLLVHTRDENDDSLTEDELIGHASILYIAGHETTATSLAWTTLLLAQHRQIYTELLEELDSVLGGNPPSLDKLNELDLLDRVIKESLRLFAPTMWTVRVLQEPFELAGHQLDAGTTIALSHYVTHRLPEVYDNPDTFDPDRWLTISPSAYEYMPFSAGVRMCIGATFATMEMKIVLAIMLQRYRFQLIDGRTINRKPRNAGLFAPNDLPIHVMPNTATPQRVNITGNVHDSITFT